MNEAKVLEFGVDMDDVYHEKDSILYEYDWNNRVLGYAPPNTSHTLRQFVESQFVRFNVPLFDFMPELIETTWAVVAYTFDNVDPYLLYTGYSLAHIDSQEYLRVYIVDGVELPPTGVETFSFNKNLYNDYMEALSSPALSNLPWGAGEIIEDYLFGDPGDTHVFYSMSVEAQQKLLTVLETMDSIEHLFRLVAWSCVVWLMSEDGQVYLAQNDDITSAVSKYGEAILHVGSVFTPEEYTYDNRPALSCVVCHKRVWCATDTLENGIVTSMCESCSSHGMRLVEYGCGSKFCKYWQCPSHSHHHLGNQGVNGYYRAHGQLSNSKKSQTNLLNR